MKIRFDGACDVQTLKDRLCGIIDWLAKEGIDEVENIRLRFDAFAGGQEAIVTTPAHQVLELRIGDGKCIRAFVLADGLKLDKSWGRTPD